MNLRIGDMAQLVERRVRNAKARGSNPLISTSGGASEHWALFVYSTGFVASIPLSAP